MGLEMNGQYTVIRVRRKRVFKPCCFPVFLYASSLGRRPHCGESIGSSRDLG